MSQLMHVGRPNITDPEKFLTLARGILESGWLTNNGEFVQELERRVAARLGVAHVVAVCNATVAIQILMAAALPKSGRVIVPDFTFIATAHAVRAAGHQVVVADVDRSTHCLSPHAVKDLLSRDVVGIMGVHLWGHPCFVEELQAIAHGSGIPLFFDAAHSFGSKYKGASIGTFGEAEVFSFHATKIINGFEGGAIVTNDAGLAEKCRLARNFGFVDTDTVVSFGINGKMSEISAAMVLVNLDHLDKLIAQNKERHSRYTSLLEDVEGLKILAPDRFTESNYHYCVMEVDPRKYGRSRDELVSWLWKHGVRARRYFYPGVSRCPPYDRDMRSEFPMSRDLCESVVVLPTGAALSLPDIERVVSLIRDIE